MNNQKNMRIIFMGTPDFAVASLDILVKHGYEIAAVITAPDKPAGRGRNLHESAVKKYALEKNLKILQPERLKNEDFLHELKGLNADLQIVVAFRMLPEIVWSMPPMGTINLHASLLPQYRGAAPINHAIINGEKETGVTTFFLKQEIDTGDIIFQEKVEIKETETAGELHDKLMEIGANLILKTVQNLETGNLKTIEQDKIKSKINHAPKIFKEDCKINWNDSVENIYNKIRGLSPYPAAFTEFETLEGKIIPVKIFFSTTDNCSPLTKPGTIESDMKNTLKIAGTNGWIAITELQMSGKNKMKVGDFLRGFNISTVNKAI
jgi:methionyl-tRNA formyltransferase